MPRRIEIDVNGSPERWPNTLQTLQLPKGMLCFGRMHDRHSNSRADDSNQPTSTLPHRETIQKKPATTESNRGGRAN
ncbi:hypothetical protein RE6C_02157 [Rhodopirellula europaea 6C]|uniref:Uncharacterized protein n=1 Tax=Rhodopirellula europaea 6C TaxID=1263867 RepID=M2AIZ6_9BACT|nr:hypothetical protein RE6C_02157 [Rhodopirellula europaea 6C]